MAECWRCSLPMAYDDPTWWSEAEVRELLAGTNLLQGALLRRAWLRRIFDALVPPLCAARPDLFPARRFTREAFAWAHSAFSSRGFPHVLSVRPGEDLASGPPASASSVAAAEVAATPAAAAPTVADAAVSSSVAAILPSSLAAASAASEMAAADGPNPFQHPPHVPVGCMLPVLDVLNHRPRTPIAWLRLADRVAFVCEPPTTNSALPAQWPLNWPDTERYVQNAEASFVDVIVRTLFGWRPDWVTPAAAPRSAAAAAIIDASLYLPTTSRGDFEGTLSMLRTPLGYINITAGAAGLTWVWAD